MQGFAPCRQAVNPFSRVSGAAGRVDGAGSRCYKMTEGVTDIFPPVREGGRGAPRGKSEGNRGVCPRSPAPPATPAPNGSKAVF